MDNSLDNLLSFDEIDKIEYEIQSEIQSEIEKKIRNEKEFNIIDDFSRKIKETIQTNSLYSHSEYNQLEAQEYFLEIKKTVSDPYHIFLRHQGDVFNVDLLFNNIDYVFKIIIKILNTIIKIVEHFDNNKTKIITSINKNYYIKCYNIILSNLKTDMLNNYKIYSNDIKNILSHKNFGKLIYKRLMENYSFNNPLLFSILDTNLNNFNVLKDYVINPYLELNSVSIGSCRIYNIVNSYNLLIHNN
jgi:hypothetical protein